MKMRQVDFNETEVVDKNVPADHSKNGKAVSNVAKQATWEELRQELEATMIKTPYLRFNTDTGGFEAGKDKTPVDLKKCYILIPSVMKTLAVFTNGVVDAPPVYTARKALFAAGGTQIDNPYEGDSKYNPVEGFEFVIKDADTGEEYWFTAKNKTTVNCTKNLLRDIFVHIPDTTKPPLETDYVPVCEVEVYEFITSFKKKQKGLRFHIIEWVKMEDIDKFKTPIQID